MSGANRLLEQVVREGNDACASDLLVEFQRGFPVKNLLRLIRSEKEGAVRVAVWIASELGEQSAPLVPELQGLLQHPAKYVRFFALDAILASASEDRGDALAAAVSLVEDIEAAVRWKALQFLARAEPGQLRGSLHAMQDTKLCGLVEWLIAATVKSKSQEIITRIDDPDPVARIFAVAAARRLAESDPSPLIYGAQSQDAEVRSFAVEELKGIGNL